MTKEQLEEIANKLVAFCKNQQESEALNTLYSENAVSVEAAPMTGTGSAETSGLDGIKGKHDWWNNTMEVHSSHVDGPYLHGDNRFGVIFDFKATNKESGEDMSTKELAIYTVEAGKIIREEFFYTV